MRNPSETVAAIVLGIRDYFAKNEMAEAVIGLSGGLDSAVACALAVKALGKEHVHALILPDEGTTTEESIGHARQVALQLGIVPATISINSIYEPVLKVKKIVKAGGNKRSASLALANSKARSRMIVLYHYAALISGLVLGTSDKSEIALGYSTKHGDGASDLMVIADVWKTEVRALARHLGILPALINKPSTPELLPGTDAEKELGASYEVLDEVLKLHIEQQKSQVEIIAEGFDKELAQQVCRRVRINEHKRRSAMVIRLSERSFHNLEWRMPVTNRYEG
ncbi:TPA: NAD(+) synthase [Candidatus Woesearchaeota archaeon]|nr:NAD(+) synthase [Candidatus Woesearchaeota archaeon]HII69506.1 NAD(+) synthase [Candidatus Woesearchaeota archaeon]